MKKKLTKLDKIMRELVIDEATKLREHATKDELSKLDFAELSPQYSRTCIYGQITGSCFSDRATTLILKCAKQIYVSYTRLEIGELSETKSPNGVDKRGGWFSPIEVFIAQDEEGAAENNKILIDYLKGETETLNFV